MPRSDSHTYPMPRVRMFFPASRAPMRAYMYLCDAWFFLGGGGGRGEVSGAGVGVICSGE